MKIQKRLAILLIAIAMCVLCILSMSACSECTHVFGDELTVITEPACHTPGSAYKTCTLCGEKVVVETTVPHNYGEYVYNENAGCVTNGTEVATCQNEGCSKTSVRIVEPTGHTFTTYIPVAATCTSPSGEMAYCDVCGAESERREVDNPTPPTSHDFAGGETCVNCGELADGLTIVGEYDLGNVQAVLYDTGVLQDPENTSSKNRYTLVFSGEGAIVDFERPYTTSIPWYEKRASITTVRIEEGITAIGKNTFINHKKIDTLILPESLTSIGESAFAKGSCGGAEFTLPAGVTAIGANAFTEIASLLVVNIPADSQLLSIGESAFEGCEKLHSITLPDSLVSIASRAFRTCKALKSITFGPNISDLALDAFDRSGLELTDYEGGKYLASGENAHALLLTASSEKIKSCKIHKDTLSVSLNAFSSCPDLTSITVEDGNAVYSSVGNCVIRTSDKTLVLAISTAVIPTDGSVTSIAPKAFNGLSALKSITIPSVIERVESGAFTGCTALKSVTVEEGVGTIGSAAFDGCTALAEITLPFLGAGDGNAENASFFWIFGEASDVPATLTKVTLVGVTDISTTAFMNCASIKELHLPATLESIGMSAFLGCTSLTKVYVEDLESWSAIDFKDYYSSPLYLAKNLYVNGALVTDLVIPEGTTEINYAAFAGANITSVTLPSTLESIGEAAFLGCAKITEIDLVNVETLGAFAFSGCTSLARVTLSESIRKINAYTFISCESLTELVIPSAVTSIDLTAFTSCRMLSRITVASGNSVYKSVDGALALVSDGSIIFTPAAHVPTVEEE